MSISFRACVICGEALEYYEQAREMPCAICGKKELTNAACEKGHYVCDECHRKGAVEGILDLVEGVTTTDPFEVLNIFMDQPETHMHGPEHHQLIGCALAVAYANAGGDLDLKKAIPEILNRGGKVPGGTCGLWGTCGAGVASGIFLSVALGQTPLHGDHYSDVERQTARVHNAIAEIGGPRCCKRNGYLSLMQAVAYTNEVTGSKMTLPEHIECKYFANNKECLHGRCPFFPGSKTPAPGTEVTVIGTPNVA